MLGINIVTSMFSLADRTVEKAFVDSGKLDLGLISGLMALNLRSCAMVESQNNGRIT